MRYMDRRIAGGALVALLSVAGCDYELLPPYEAEGTGDLAGRVFFDANRNGTFEPLAGDEALPGVTLAVLERGTSSVVAGGTATTNAQGEFTISGLPPGTHELLIRSETVPEGVAICQNPIPTTVYLAETAFQPVGGRGGCVIEIEEAEARPLGSPVTIQGIVTSFPGQMDPGYTFIQDATGGIRIFDSGLEGRGIEIGDRIEVSGTMAAFNDDLQLTGVTLNATEKDVAAPEVQSVTTATIAAAGSPPSNPLQGRLVRVTRARLATGFGQGGLNIQNGAIDDGSGAVQIRIEDGVADRNTLNSVMKVGSCYTVTGAVGNFRGTAQLFPRATTDIVEVPCS